VRLLILNIGFDDSKEGDYLITLKRKILLLGLVMAILTLGATLADQWKIISTIYTSETTTVSDPQLLDVWIDESAKPPAEVMVGQRFTILITINNTNSISLNVFVMVNVTSDHAISHFVDVGEVWPLEGNSVVLGESSDPCIIVYIIQNVGLAPGLNTCVTGLTIQYNKTGNYTLKVAVVQ